VQAEGAQFRLVAIAVAAFAADGTPLPVSPCGACRQALVEFGADAAVSFRQPDGGWVEVIACDLLPHRFVLPQR
jgi:cytidine deaminase